MDAIVFFKKEVAKMGLFDQFFQVDYNHRSSTGSVTTGHHTIKANSASEARKMFNEMHKTAPAGSYKATDVTRKK